MNNARLPDTYRRMTAADLDTVEAIERRMHPSPWTRGNFSDSIGAGYHCWIAERDGGLAAYAVVAVGAEEAHLLNLTVAPQWQRQGIGAAFTAFLAKLARDYGAGRMFLEVRPSNGAARALYARAGFAEIGLRRGYYPATEGREDAVVMEMAL
ncbi:MAG TPA: ribosomal protein S18-alanine N-acetyltransferase [Burkholderiales bacterium]|nr:ribosomal protein S18-alanine N-acetyltransferase [Burkholderiales bacterium]